MDQNEVNGRLLVQRSITCANKEAEADGWVYMIVAGGGGVKIGRAISYMGVRRQVTYAQTYAENGINRVVLIHGGGEMERRLHKRFAAERQTFRNPPITSATVREFKSEWFKGPLTTAYVFGVKAHEPCEWCTVHG